MKVDSLFGLEIFLIVIRGSLRGGMGLMSGLVILIMIIHLMVFSSYLGKKVWTGKIVLGCVILMGAKNTFVPIKNAKKEF